MIVDLVVLRDDKYQAPQVRDEPCVYRVIPSVCGDQDLGHLRQEAFEGESLQVGCQVILIDIDYLVRLVGAIFLYQLISVLHGLVVGVRDAGLDIWNDQCLFPLLKPFWARPSCFLLNSAQFRLLLISSLWHFALLGPLGLIYILIDPLLLGITYVLESPEARVHRLLLAFLPVLRLLFSLSLMSLVSCGSGLPIVHKRYLLFFDGTRVLLVYDYFL